MAANSQRRWRTIPLPFPGPKNRLPVPPVQPAKHLKSVGFFEADDPPHQSCARWILPYASANPVLCISQE
jgi:hypothetical protein